MQRIISKPRDESRHSPLHRAMREGAQEIEAPPTPGELFFEAGIVLAVALGVAVVGGFIAAIA